MQIGRPGAPVSHISQAYPDRVEVRGHDLCGDLMGRVSFTEYFHLLLTGREPTDDQRYFLDLLLVAIAEHGMMPTNVAARMTLAADPGSLHGAVAAGILGCGPVILGTSELCARLLEDAQRAVAAGGEPAEVATALVAFRPRLRRQGARLRPSRAPAARPPRRADPRARRRARRERAARPARPVPPRRRGRGVGQAADDERRPADRGGAARPRLPARGREGRADPRAHGGPARSPRRGAGAAARLPAGGEGRGGDRVRAPARPPGPGDARAGGRDPPLGGPARRRRRGLPRPARVPLRALGLLSRQAGRGRRRVRRRGGRARRHRAAAADRQARAARDLHAGQPRRDAPLRDPVGDRPDPLDERHHRHADLHPADGRRPRQLGDRLGAQLRRVRRACRPAPRLHLQRRAVRGGRRARRLRPHRRLPHPRRARGTASGCCRRSSCSGPRRSC